MVKKCPIVQKKTVCAQKMETYERFKVFEQYEELFSWLKAIRVQC